MTKILVLLTGGTIGSRAGGGIIDTGAETSYDLIRLYREIYGSDADFEIISPYNILSENLNPGYWEILCDIISGTDPGRYDGIIITHGSDTLSYTSALLGIAFGDTPIPIVLVAGNLPPEDPGSNALANFRNAVCLIKERAISGVFTIYQDDAGKNNVYLATEVMEADPHSHRFLSCRGKPFGEMTDERLAVINPSEKKCDGLPFKPGESVRFDRKVLVIRPYPGLDYNFFSLTGDTAAVLHRLYHSSTACTAKGEYSLLEFIKKCVERGIPFYASPFRLPGADLYAGSKSLLEAGAVPVYELSLEAAYAKLMLKYNRQY